MADKAEIDIDRHKYSVKKADTAPHPADEVIDGTRCAINMTRILILLSTNNRPLTTTYHVSTSRHSDKTGALIDHGVKGIDRADCLIIKEMSHFVNIEGIDNHVME